MLPDLRLFLPKRVPLPLIVIGILATTASWVPLSMIFLAIQTKSDKPRVHLFQDMDNQAKLKAQAASPIFIDGRAMRPPVPGTVRRGELNEDPLLHEGYVVAEEKGEFVADFIAGFPEEIEVDGFFLARGREQYNNFCYTCHGLDGYGHGPTNVRATALVTGDGTLSYGTAWVAAANLHETLEDGSLRFGADTYPNGQLYHVIDAGKGNMKGYGHAISVEDRWAIVAYVRALQLSQNADAAQLAMDRADVQGTRSARLTPVPSPGVTAGPETPE
ncbi:MAG: cytochrome c [Planctomycetota bacterium]